MPAPGADVVILGGGLVGASLAYECACAGLGVTVVDGALAGRASDAGAGIVSPETFHDPDAAWFEFGAAAARHLRLLVERLGQDGETLGPETFAVCGSVVVALAEHEDPWFGEVCALARARSPAVREITPAEAGSLFPPLAPVWRALLNPDAARLDGRRLRRAVLDGAVRRGAALVGAEAVGLQRRGDRVTAVRTADGSVGCDALVLAGGAWAGAAAEWSGVTLPVRPTKGQIVHVVLPADDVATAAVPSERWPIVQPVLNFYLVPWPAGRVACGGTFEAEAGFDVRPTAGGLHDLLRECVSLAPGLAGATFHEVRVGLRPSTPDDRPYLGALPGTANVHVCTGHGANGLLLGPYSAALVAGGLAGDLREGRGTPGSHMPYPANRLAH